MHVMGALVKNHGAQIWKCALLTKITTCGSQREKYPLSNAAPFWLSTGILYIAGLQYGATLLLILLVIVFSLMQNG